jgi:hypothetical protein
MLESGQRNVNVVFDGDANIKELRNLAGALRDT